MPISSTPGGPQYQEPEAESREPTQRFFREPLDLRVLVRLRDVEDFRALLRFRDPVDDFLAVLRLREPLVDFALLRFRDVLLV